MIKIIKQLQTIPFITKFFLNHYAPYRGAGIQVESIQLKQYLIRVKMPLTRKNQNIVGVHFGGSLYSMVDPFYMLLLMHHLGSQYIVWDKAAEIHFLTPGRGTVYANIQLSAGEISKIKDLAEDHAPVLRHYSLDIVDESGLRIAEVKKTLYIRRKKSKQTTASKA